jgi:hypothetical protein
VRSIVPHCGKSSNRMFFGGTRSGASVAARNSATEPEEMPLGVCWCHGGGALVGGGGLAVSSQPAKQIGSGGVERVVVVEVQLVHQR